MCQELIYLFSVEFAGAQNVLAQEHMGRDTRKSHWNMRVHAWWHCLGRGEERVRYRLWGPLWKEKEHNSWWKGESYKKAMGLSSWLISLREEKSYTVIFQIAFDTITHLVKKFNTIIMPWILAVDIFWATGRLSWQSIATVSQRSQGSNPLKPWLFQASFSQLMKLGVHSEGLFVI